MRLIKFVTIILSFMFLAAPAVAFVDDAELVELLKQNKIETLSFVGFVETGDEYSGDFISEKKENIVEMLTALGGYDFDIIVRDTDYRDKVLEQLNIEIDDLYDEHKIHEFGKLWGADCIVVSKIIRGSIHLRFINTETGNIIVTRKEDVSLIKKYWKFIFGALGIIGLMLILVIALSASRNKGSVKLKNRQKFSVYYQILDSDGVSVNPLNSIEKDSEKDFIFSKGSYMLEWGLYSDDLLYSMKFDVAPRKECVLDINK